MAQEKTRKYLGYIKVTTNANNSWVTAYNKNNVTRKEVVDYFMGSVFNLGTNENKEVVTKVEFLD